MEHDRNLRKSNYTIIPAIVLLMSYGLIFIDLYLYRDSESDRPSLRHVFVHCFPSSFKRQSLWNSDTGDVIRHTQYNGRRIWTREHWIPEDEVFREDNVCHLLPDCKMALSSSITSTSRLRLGSWPITNIDVFLVFYLLLFISKLCVFFSFKGMYYVFHRRFRVKTDIESTYVTCFHILTKISKN